MTAENALSIVYNLIVIIVDLILLVLNEELLRHVGQIEEKF